MYTSSVEERKSRYCIWIMKSSKEFAFNKWTLQHAV
uniref:Uncharacterized protein n=1 Tax=Caenorhabditis japonica TaxID=281687 RepID=A0A8R1ET04_CAEJA